MVKKVHEDTLDGAKIMEGQDATEDAEAVEGRSASFVASWHSISSASYHPNQDTRSRRIVYGGFGNALFLLLYLYLFLFSTGHFLCLESS